MIRWIFLVLTQRTISHQVDFSLHSDTLPRLLPNPFFDFTSKMLVEKHQIPILWSLVWPDQGLKTGNYCRLNRISNFIERSTVYLIFMYVHTRLVNYLVTGHFLFVGWIPSFVERNTVYLIFICPHSFGESPCYYLYVHTRLVNHLVTDHSFTFYRLNIKLRWEKHFEPYRNMLN